MTNPYQILTDALGHDITTRVRIALELAGLDIYNKHTIDIAPHKQPKILEDIVEVQELQ